MRLFFRLVGLLLLAGAFAALVIDGTRSVATGAIDILSLDQTLLALSPQQFAKFRSVVQLKLPILWDPILTTILRLPTWSVLGALGLVLLAATRRRAPLIGYVRR